MSDKNTDNLLTMALNETPICFKTKDGVELRLYQPTLGKARILSPLYEEVALADSSSMDKVTEVISGKKDIICRILAIHSLNKSSDILNPFKVDERAALFIGLDDSDIVTLYTAPRTWPSYAAVAQALGITEEIERKGRLMKAKDTTGSIPVGGVSIYGQLIDGAMERYGWSLQYTLWGITLINLQLLMSDISTSIYLSKDELKKVSAIDKTRKSDVINGDDPKNMARIAAIFNKKH